MNENTQVAVIEPQELPLHAPKEQQMVVGKAALEQPMTAAQAKVDAVANLTFKAYERASTLQLTKEEIDALQREFPDESFRLGAGGDDRLIYIEHAHLRDRLNQVFAAGQWAIIPRNRWAENFTTDKGNPACRVYVEAMLVIRGCFCAEAIGDMVYYPNNAKTNYGDAVEGAKSACLRRCAKELGIGLQAWKKDFCEGWKKRNPSGYVAPRPTQQPASRPTPAPAPSAAPEPKPTAKAPASNEARLNRMFQRLHEAKFEDSQIQEYAVKSGILLPTETLKDWGETCIPTDKTEMDMLIKWIQQFVDGGEVHLVTTQRATETTPSKESIVDDVPEIEPELPIEPEPEPAQAYVLQEGELVCAGKVEQISSNPGQSKKGKPYVKYGIKVDSQWHNSFDKAFADTAEAAKKNSHEIKMTYKEGKYGREIVAVEIIGEVTP